MNRQPLLDVELIRYVQHHFPQWTVQLAPDIVASGSRRLICIHATHEPLHGLLGRMSIVDVELYDPDRTLIMTTASDLIDVIDIGFTSGELPGVSSVKWVTLPTVVNNPSAAKSSAVCAFAFTCYSHYRID